MANKLGQMGLVVQHHMGGGNFPSSDSCDYQIKCYLQIQQGIQEHKTSGLMKFNNVFYREIKALLLTSGIFIPCDYLDTFDLIAFIVLLIMYEFCLNNI